MPLNKAVHQPPDHCGTEGESSLGACPAVYLPERFDGLADSATFASGTGS